MKLESVLQSGIKVVENNVFIVVHMEAYMKDVNELLKHALTETSFVMSGEELQIPMQIIDK